MKMQEASTKPKKMKNQLIQHFNLLLHFIHQDSKNRCLACGGKSRQVIKCESLKVSLLLKEICCS